MQHIFKGGGGADVSRCNVLFRGAWGVDVLWWWRCNIVFRGGSRATVSACPVASRLLGLSGGFSASRLLGLPGGFSASRLLGFSASRLARRLLGFAASRLLGFLASRLVPGFSASRLVSYFAASRLLGFSACVGLLGFSASGRISGPLLPVLCEICWNKATWGWFLLLDVIAGEVILIQDWYLQNNPLVAGWPKEAIRKVNGGTPQ